MKLVRRDLFIKKVASICGINDSEYLVSVKKGDMKLDSLISAAEVIDDNSRDIGAEIKKVSFGYSNGYYIDLNGEKYNFTKHSLSQIGNRYGIPYSYISKCGKVNYQDLIETNFSRWIKDDKAVAMFRTYKERDVNYLRGFVSVKYVRFDTKELLSKIYDSPLADWDVRGYLISPSRFSLRLVSPMEVGTDDLYFGVNIDSSDVGRRSISIRALLYRQVCSNGLILPISNGILYRQVHIGSGAEDMPNKVAASLKNVPMLIEKARKMIDDVTHFPIPFVIGDEEKEIAFRRKYKLGKEFMENVITMYQNQQATGEFAVNTNKWYFINCMTEVAQKYDIDTRLEYEKAAGSLLVG